jgi:hypothetical protein
MVRLRIPMLLQDHQLKDNPLPTSPRGGGNFYKNKNNPFIR